MMNNSGAGVKFSEFKLDNCRKNLKYKECNFFNAAWSGQDFRWIKVTLSGLVWNFFLHRVSSLALKV